MQDPTSEPQPNVSRIIAGALQSAADGMSRWLDTPVVAERISTCSLERQAAENALGSAPEMVCCCIMPVAMVAASGQDSSLAAQSDSAGRLLMAWSEEGAAKLIDLSLHCVGTPRDQNAWQGLDRSVISETLNVVGCEFLNEVAVRVSELSHSEIALMPSPPEVTRRCAGSLMEATGATLNCDGSAEASSGSIASSRLCAAGNSLETRFAMVWTPAAWQRLTSLVQSSVDPPDCERRTRP